MQYNWFSSSLLASDPLRGASVRALSGGHIRAYDAEIELLKRSVDSMLVLFSLFLAGWLYGQPWSDKYTIAAISALALFFVASKFNHLYISSRCRRITQEITPLLLTWFSVIAGLLILGYMFRITHEYSRVILGIWFLTTPVVILLWRLVLKSGLGYFRSRGHNSRSTVIIGTGECAQRLAGNIRRMNWMGLNFQGFISVSNHEKDGETLGGLDKLYEMIDQHEVDVIYITLPLTMQQQIDEILEAISDSTVSTFLVPNMDHYGIAQSRWVTVGDIPTVSIVETPMLGSNAGLKRLEDIIVSTVAIFITTPVMALIALAIKLDSKGPVFYKQNRHGLDGKVISVWKFRSMSVMEKNHDFKQATKNDSRITRVGAFLRRTSLDELPQFFNVLAGDMSVVGPRPHAVAHNNEYRGSIWGYMQRHKVKPGLTGLAQVKGYRGETETKEKMQRRVRCDMEYINNWSIWLDLKLILITPFTLLTGKNAY